MIQALDLKFVNKCINVKTTTAYSSGSKVLIGIPGGPGISGEYMWQSTVELAKILQAAPLLVDLPNHGLSGRLKSDTPIMYPEVHAILSNFLLEISKSGSTISLFGHSLGAIIALDLFCLEAVNIEKTLLVSMPIEIERNPEFTSYLKKVSAIQFSDEASFAEWWKSVLPAYFESPPTAQNVQTLTGTTSWFSNLQFTNGLPSAARNAARLSPALTDKILYLQGSQDIILPAENYERLRRSLPKLPMSIVSNSGHFPMLENPQEFIAQASRFK